MKAEQSIISTYVGITLYLSPENYLHYSYQTHSLAISAPLVVRCGGKMKLYKN